MIARLAFMILALIASGAPRAEARGDVVSFNSGYPRGSIVVVTHDEELASAAQRVVHMRDGEIVG